ncbi:MAG: calcium/sodium antiporter [Candidatus Endonucleobacter bathymodioli]|uniref:Calcium/sodium antiporter n=1 Tax=Candidatus Endonucleibacter bathymodioli TaxID=539814 RepID=A0AA90NKZ3_9GAMM|nr:calcium/sodium antiporter [Candidatus Endonucleobacter bathymodioli]
MDIATIAIVFGVICLTWSADQFVVGAIVVAQYWKVSPMLIGLTVVSLGTSAPEIWVSVMAVTQGHVAIAVGNAIGSNITNIGLVLGVTTLIAPLTIKKSIACREIPWLVLVTIIVGGCLLNLYLGLIDSLMLLGLLLITLYLMFWWQKKHSEEPLEEPLEEAGKVPRLSTAAALFKLSGGLVVLLISSKALIWGAVQVAEFMGISDLVIGLTVIAIGTSLPELAASIMSVIRHQHDIALGNIVGSNIFNLLAVLAVPGLLAPGKIDSSVISRDYPIMLGLTLLLAAFAIGKQSKSIGRLAGLMFLLSYCFYSVWLYMGYI